MLEAFEEPNPFNKGVEGQCISIHKQEDPEPRGGQKSIASKVAQSHLNTKAREFIGLTGRSQPPLIQENEYILPGDFISKMALTIKQGIALLKKELAIFNGDPLK